MKESSANKTQSIQLVDAETLAERYGVAAKTIRKWGREGILPVVRFSRRAHRYNLADCDAIVERRTVQTMDDI